MYSRLQKPVEASFFLVGPRGTGESAWVTNYGEAGVEYVPAAEFLRELPERL